MSRRTSPQGLRPSRNPDRQGSPAKSTTCRSSWSSSKARSSGTAMTRKTSSSSWFRAGSGWSFASRRPRSSSRGSSSSCRTGSRGSLVEPTFRLPFEFTVPDVLYERELKDPGGPDLVSLGLRVEELDGDGVALALGYLRSKRRALSLPDSFALALAKTNSWMLLSGDRGLRELAEEEEVARHGVLWLLDRIFDHRVIERNDLCAGLGQIAAHPRCRLPKAEIRKRLLCYSAS